MNVQVLVLGAGPSGSMAALRLKQLGIEDVLVVDQSDFPRSKPCAGGIAPAAEKFIRARGLEHLLELQPQGVMKSVRFVDPAGTENTASSSLKALAINRNIFDKALLDEAVNAGARFKSGFVVRDLLTDDAGEVYGATDGKEEIYADVVIMATGGHNREMREKYFPDKRSLRVMTSRIAWYDDFPIPSDQLEMIFDPMLLPHYGWVFPEGNGRVNIGICMFHDRLEGKTVNQVFDQFLDKYYGDRMPQAKQVDKAWNYPINTSTRVGKVVSGRLLLCGEAARLCDPLTAEGISYALESGFLAAEACGRFYTTGKKVAVLGSYQKACRRAFNSRLRFSAFFRWFVTTRGFTFMVKLSSHPAIKGLLDRIMT